MSLLLLLAAVEVVLLWNSNAGYTDIETDIIKSGQGELDMQ